MKDELTTTQTDAILKALDDAIDQGPWEESNFLRVIGKNLREIRENFANQLASTKSDKNKAESYFAKPTVPAKGQQEIFIGIYCSEGGNIQAWERIIANLPRQIVSRPVYNNEDDIKNLIKSKENKVNEAYVSIYINQNDILPIPIDKMAVDKFGKRLLNLKDRSLNLDNVQRFVHSSGVYVYRKGQLIKSAPGG